MYDVVGRRSVGPQYILLLTLTSYTPLRYVRNVAREDYRTQQNDMLKLLAFILVLVFHVLCYVTE